MTRLSLAAGGLLLVVLVAPLAAADEIATAPEDALTLRLADLDLLPLGEFEAQDLRAKHPKVVQRLQGLAYQYRTKTQQLAKRKDKQDAESQKLRGEIAKVLAAAKPLLEQATQLLREHGLTDAMIAMMAEAPRDRTRVERYAHRLVLLLDLDPAQRALFERVEPQVDGAYATIQALEDRAKLALKQAALEKGVEQGVLNGFKRQARDTDRRFWRLVDYVLDVDQKAALWELLPQAIRRHDSAVDHVYALSSLTASQGGRVRSLVAEMEAESAPDQALVKRVQQRVRDKSLSREERQALSQEQREAYGRLNALKRYAHETTLEILTPEQIHELKGIPPRVSINDRRANGKRVLEGLELDGAQNARIEALRKEGGRAAKRYRERMKAIRAETGDVGPDSPQMMMMEMMMAGARGQAMATQRELLGRVFLEVLRPDQVTGWVMGLYGYRR